MKLQKRAQYPPTPQSLQLNDLLAETGRRLIDLPRVQRFVDEGATENPEAALRLVKYFEHKMKYARPYHTADLEFLRESVARLCGLPWFPADAPRPYRASTSP